ncbi:Hpt domain-containing protein [Pseudarthrobacter sp. NamE2]|uniref:Hpt domain-containing protein n=1 Tax=Pseudarthrobacter sp. NamE2 TaxID=2576838 RepID=UPI0010FEEFB1|nr:Hpt domain-containing protein [Pseudarthrobacter sp. NamE2]TLM83672.1 Hpt domain-containing protein [Pseudarthrobacter sp. NamE2]
MTQENGFTLPILDKAVLDRLRDELEDDEGIWRLFVQDFITQLPRRTERLRAALTGGDMAEAVDAVLSLRTSSQMVGAERLAAIALHVEEALRQATGADPADALPRLAATYQRRINQCGEQTRNLLKALLRDRPNKTS